ncbi:MAG: hypothetical protein JWR54_582 [Mucilaginibacter sp.]|nr:hypothetical protein [Mucilaginibacter sp.]
MKAIIFKNWFGYAAVISLLCGIIFIVGQQAFRASADDPQYQMAEDAANTINNGADPKSLISTATTLEIAKTLSPYLIIYDSLGNVAAGSAVLNGKPLKLPQGVLVYIQKHGADHATWQPQPGVRQAMVGLSTNASKGYAVIAGRSLRKTDERIERLGEQVAFGWAMSLLAMLVVVTLQQMATKKWNLE